MEQKLPGYSCNEAAAEMVETLLLPRQEELRIKHYQQNNGCHIIDMGVEMPGGWLAGKYFTDISLCGLGETRFTRTKVGDYVMPAVSVFVDFADVAEMSSHVAFWRVMHDGIEKNFSGPGRAKVGDAYAQLIPYRDKNPKKIVAAYQIDYVPHESLTALVAQQAGVEPENLYLMIASTGSIVGSIQVCARNVEQTYPTLADKGFDLQKIRYACAVTPITAIVKDEMEAYGRVNDCLIYGQETNIYVECDDEEITSIIPLFPMNQERNTEVYGVPFKEIFARCNNDWCQVPRNWDAPSKVNFYNLKTNHYFPVGAHCTEVLVGGFKGRNGGNCEWI